MSRFSGLIMIALTVLDAQGVTASHASAQAIDATDAEAHGLFDAGTAAFDDGRFEEAYGYFTHAYTLSRRAELLFNIASTCERLRRDREAIGHYQAYLDAIPDAPNRRFVEGRLRFLSAATQVAPAPTESREPRADVVSDPVADAPAATTELAPSDAALSSAIATQDADASRDAALQAAPRPQHRRRRALIWTSVGVVVAAAVAAGLAVSLRGPDVQAPIAGDVGPSGILIALTRGEARR